ncbi:Hypothetical protein R9X50_00143000 [Acrodontium crateriforme]|uniref:ATP synthase regulation protein NCA2 n=1 Tax=Acrodontium crateriforme TaxID=150365 RepID=A0AAQ3LZQ7_9PEZI|nr:Hypothetical protein R9X50_00143000 [Acrodontium crateriforme]
MSFVLDQVRRIDAQLDRVQLANFPAATATTNTTAQLETRIKPSERQLALQTAIRSLAPGTSDSRALLKPTQIQQLLSILLPKDDFVSAAVFRDDSQTLSKDAVEEELEWLVISKATTQVYGHVLDRILGETVSLANDLYYWDSVLGSRSYTALYGVQISPFRFRDWTNTIWTDVKARGGRFSVRGAGQDASDSITQSWTEFYGLVKQVVEERSVESVGRQVATPITRLRRDIRQKQAHLKKIRLRNANALGVLLGEGLANESVHGDGLVTPNSTNVQHRWKTSMARNVALMEAVLVKVNDLETPVDKFDTAIGELTEDDPLYMQEVGETSSEAGPLIPQTVAERLARVLAMALPQYTSSTGLTVRDNGKPSRLVRYWLPVTLGIISSSTILRILVNRQAEILQWVQDLGLTAIDFWRNWVIEPTRKVIQTIRHDEASEVSIMSKRSLEGDRDSLERMVVDFAIENPANATGSSAKLSEAQIADIRLQVREGDLTPVLRAYEKDLTSPFIGAVRGNLIRALLIQIQKTKVDVEIAMGGIDSLLKSQELVFGFIGLTPGLLVSYFVGRWVHSIFTTKRGSAAARKSGQMVRQLRNIDRILTAAQPTDFGELHYKDQGLLICEVHVLRQAVEKAMPAAVYREFGEDSKELCDVRSGLERQRMVANRIRWAYKRFLN